MAIDVKTLSVSHLPLSGRLPDPPPIPGLSPEQEQVFASWWNTARHKIQSDSDDLKAVIEDIYRKLVTDTSTPVVEEAETVSTVTNVVATRYLHEQNVGSNVWVINHNLGVYPAVTLLSDDYEEVVASVVHATKNTSLIYFNFDTTGKAILT